MGMGGGEERRIFWAIGYSEINGVENQQYHCDICAARAIALVPLCKGKVRHYNGPFASPGISRFAGRRDMAIPVRIW